MTTYKKNRYFVSGLLFTVIALTSYNLISCGGSGNDAPVIAGISPSIGIENLTPPGPGKGCTFSSPGSVTLTGANFGTAQGTSFVTFDNYNAGAAVSWGDTSIVVNAPANATPQPSDPRSVIGAGGYYNAAVPVQVTVSNYQVSNAVTFTYSVTCR